MRYYAHSTNDSGERQLLTHHLNNVAALAQLFCKDFGAEDTGYLVGLCHDLGKADANWQPVLSGQTGRKIDHRAAGARILLENFQGLAVLVFPILGHHGGLLAYSEMDELINKKDGSENVREATEFFLAEIKERLNDLTPELPDYLESNDDTKYRLSTEFFLRMLFSAIVDADFLDTEQHFEPDAAAQRAVNADLQTLHRHFMEDQARLKPNSPINEIRQSIYNAALKSAEQPPGFFSLTVPTGGGKTRTGMAFAIEHALTHGQRRIIVVIPYTSIIEQTVDEYRKIFGPEAVVEHHSSMTDGKEYEINKLAAENWDAPVIVTTSVQFFESLHARKPSRCRKLHNVANSVVILDEVQTLPEALIEPTLNVMRELTANYGVSFVFSTATQPAFQERPGFPGIADVREIAPDPADLFQKMERTQYHLHETPVCWEDLAAEIQRNEQVLVIVNTRRDAVELYRNLKGQEAIHLSANQCPAHRRVILREVKKRLQSGRPCRLISTQVVEAGVDIDFPVVFRAFGPLDSIVQAAGRCNREGRRDKGIVTVFTPQDGGMPPGAYRRAADIAKILLQKSSAESLHAPDLFNDYFSELYDVSNLDEHEIIKSRMLFDYPKTAMNFKMIPDGAAPVIVAYPDAEHRTEMVRRIAGKPYLTRRDFRAIQNYTVSIWPHQLRSALQSQQCREIRPGLYEWLGDYDEKIGIIDKEYKPDEMIY